MLTSVVLDLAVHVVVSLRARTKFIQIPRLVKEKGKKNLVLSKYYFLFIS